MTVLRLCATSGCQRLVNSGRCDEHRREANRARKDANVVYRRNTVAWKKLRAARLALCGYRCELRVDDGCTEIATTVHVVGGGNHEGAPLSALRGACLHCHGTLDGGKRP